MNFDQKLKTFKDNYNNIKKIIKTAVKKNLINTGSGGSSNIIIINDDFVIKIVPSFKYAEFKQKPNNDYLEADIYKKLSTEFLLTNKTPHIVGFYKRYLIEDIKYIFPSKCLKLDEQLLTPWKNKKKSQQELCILKEGYNKQLVEKQASVVILENCPSTISYGFQKIFWAKSDTKKKLIQFKNLIRRVIFQFMFTLAVIQQKYPKFIHNDAFLRNILAIEEIMYDPNDYIEYNFGKRKYYLPANGIYIKLNDFGYSLNILDENSTVEFMIKNQIKSTFEIENPKRDVYTFLYDLYNGMNISSLSIKYILDNYCENKKQNSLFLSALRNEIKPFLNYKLIEKIQSKDIMMIDSLWNISESQLLMKTIKKPIEYFNNNSFSYFSSLPEEARIVQIFNS